METTHKTQVIALPDAQQLFIIREFDFPRDLVFQSFCDPSLLMRWMGPRNMKMEIEKLESRPHGSWRFKHWDASGNEFVFHGVIHQLIAEESIIRTFEYDGLPEKGHVSLEFLEFVALPSGRSRISIQSVFKSVADRDGMIRSGMEKGLQDSFLRLDNLLNDLHNH